MNHQEKTIDLARILTPLVHANGNSKDSLLTEWDEFREALVNATNKIPFESAHSRNHYPKPDADDAVATFRAFQGTTRIVLKNLQELSAQVGENIHNQ